MSVAYDCWAFRRLGVVLDAQTGAIKRWLYRDPADAGRRDGRSGGVPAHRPRGRAAHAADRRAGALAERRRRRAGVGPRLHGTRRRAPSPDEARSAGRSARRGALSLRAGRGEGQGDGWTVTAAGPTTSIREEPYQADVIKRYGVRAVIGKGGMGAKTLAALEGSRGRLSQRHRRCGAVLCPNHHGVDGVSLLEFGTPEAMWHLTIEDFPAIVTMDAHGNSLHKDVEQASAAELAAIGA